MTTTKNRVELITEFYASPMETLFDQKTPCALLSCSQALLERQRWIGNGIPFLKIGRTVRYCKSDILKYLAQQKLCNSTSNAFEMQEANNNVK